MATITASIIGASGYSGIELLSILLRHSSVRVTALYAQSSAGKRVDELYPQFRGRTDLTFQTYDPGTVAPVDAMFIALPSGEAMHLVPGLRKKGVRVIDLGGDFRLQDTSLYQTFYKREHTATAELRDAVYGLPEWNRDAIASAWLLSNPGCYPTSVILPLAPLIKEELIAPDGIVANSLSGVSGAGRSASVEMSFGEVNESVKPYKVGVHQHIPEIETALAAVTGATASVTFVPHLLPITRGILSTIVAPAQNGISADAVGAAYTKWYGSAPFVRLLGTTPAEIRSVQRTNFIDIGWHVYTEKKQVILSSAIDNLMKGAAGQAVQNFNIMFGFAETEGLQ